MMEYLIVITDMLGEVLMIDFRRIEDFDEEGEVPSGIFDINALAKKGWRLNNMTSDGQPNTWIFFAFERAK